MNKLIAAYVFGMVNAMELRGTAEIFRHIKSSLEFMYVHMYNYIVAHYASRFVLFCNIKKENR